MSAVASMDVLGLGTSIELLSARGERVVATGVSAAAGTTTAVNRADNAADVPTDTVPTIIATVGPLTVLAGQTLDLDAMATVTNISEALGQASTCTIQVFDGVTGLLQPMQGDFSTGESGMALAWVAKGLALSPGAHTLTLQVSSSSGTGNSKVAAHQGVLSVRSFT